MWPHKNQVHLAMTRSNALRWGYRIGALVGGWMVELIVVVSLNQIRTIINLEPSNSWFLPTDTGMLF